MKKTREIQPAKTCFSHIGGRLGMLLMESFIENGWIQKSSPAEKHFFITEKGKKEFTKQGVDLSQIKPEKISGDE